MAASATFALKAGVWFRRGRLVIVSPDSRATACPLSGRNSTYRPVQISETSSTPRDVSSSWILNLFGSDAAGSYVGSSTPWRLLLLSETVCWAQPTFGAGKLHRESYFPSSTPLANNRDIIIACVRTAFVRGKGEVLN